MTTAPAREVVRMPDAASGPNHRALHWLTALYPSLPTASARAFGRLSPTSPLRRAIVRRTVQAGARHTTGAT